MSQTEQAQKLLKKVKEEIAIEQERLSVARNQRKNLESRNKSVLDNIEREGTLKRRLIDEQAISYKESLDEEILHAEKVKRHLLDDISSLNNRKSITEEEIDGLIEARDNLSKQISEDSIKLQELLDQILKLTSEIKSNNIKINDQRNIIRELSTQKQQIEADLEILRNEQDNIEGEIIEADAQFNARKKVIEDNLYEANLKLKNALDSLDIAQRKDKAFREEWAQKMMELDKRTAAVRRMEARVSDAEARIQELEKYDIL